MNKSSTNRDTPREVVAKFDESTVMLDLLDRARKSTPENDKKRITLYDELADHGEDMDEAARNRFEQYY